MKPALPRAASQGAFTLIELLVVIAIIAILASLILGVSGYVQEKAGNDRARVEIQALQTALESYKIDNGTYPTQEDGVKNDSSGVLLDALFPTKADAKIYPAIQLRMMDSFKAGTSMETIRASAKYLVDPFGNPYHYQFPGKDDRSGTNFFDLWSQGKKNSTDTNVWIKNW